MSKKRKVRKPTPSRRTPLNVGESQMADALKWQMTARSHIDDAEERMINLGNTVLAIISGVEPFTEDKPDGQGIDDYFDPPHHGQGSWFENPEAECIKGFWNLPNDRQVAVRNWCARMQAVLRTKKVLYEVAESNPGFDGEGVVVTREALDYSKRTAHVLDEYVDALHDTCAAAQSFIDGMDLDILPNMELVDTGIADD